MVLLSRSRRALAVLLCLALALYPVPRVVHAAPEHADAAETFTFSDVNVSLPEALEATVPRASGKERSAPVTASGTFVHSLPLDLPPGRLAMTPSLTLGYDSGGAQADSPAGAGWSFGVPQVSRSTRGGFPALARSAAGALGYDEAAASFDSSAGPLVPTTDGPAGATRLWAPLRERSAVRFEFQPDAEGGKWLEHDPSGVKRHYGRDGLTPAVQARVVNELGVHAWLLLMEEDAHGNYVTYRYHHAQEQQRADRRVAQRQPVLASVAWGGNHKTGLAHRFFARTVLAAWPGPVNLLHGGVVQGDRLLRVEVGSGARVYWTYALEHQPSADTGRLLLTRVVRSAPGEASVETRFTYSKNAAVTFAAPAPLTAGSPQANELYTEFSSLWRQDAQLESRRCVLQPPGLRSAYRFTDVDGDGRLDALYHPAGLRTTSARVLWYQSFRQQPGASGAAAWQSPSTAPAASQTGMVRFLGLPGADEAGPVLGLPDVPLAALADLDGDGDGDGLSFSELLTEGPRLSVPPAADLEYCGSQSFWNRCGNIDPLDLGPLRLQLFAAVGDARIGGWVGEVVGRERLRREAEAHGVPARGADALGRFARFLYGEEAVGRLVMKRLGRPVVERFSVEHLGLAPTLNPPCPPGDDPRFDPGLDPRLLPGNGGPGVDGPRGGGLPGWPIDCLPGPSGGGGPGGGPKGPGGSGGLLPGLDCLPLVRACQEATPLQKGVSAPNFTATRMTFTPYANGARTGPVALVPSQSLPGWPWAVIQSRHLEQKSAPGAFSGAARYTAHVLGDFLAPAVDLDADGRADLALLKSFHRTGVALGAPVLKYKFVPRVYMAGGAPLGWQLDSWGPAASDFGRSLADLLNGGQAMPCVGDSCDQTSPYPHTRNFNSLLADVNADGLPDLVLAALPSMPGAQGAKRLCFDGHTVQLNRGYRFEARGERALPGATWDASGSPLTLVRNRDRRCTGVDFADASLAWRAPMSTWALADVNADGRTDLVLAYGTRGQQGSFTRGTWLNTARGFVTAPAGRFQWPQDLAFATFASAASQVDPASEPLWPDTMRLVDVDGDGLVDLVRSGICQQQAGTGPVLFGGVKVACTGATWQRNAGVMPDLLTRMEASGGAWSEVAYAGAATLASLKEGVVTDPGQVHPGQQVVRQVRRAAGAGLDVETIDLAYRNFVRDVDANEAIGFERVTAHFHNAFGGAAREQVTLTRTYDVRPQLAGVAPRFPLRGAQVESVTESEGFRRTRRTVHEAVPAGAGVRLQVKSERTEDCVGTTCGAAGMEVLARDARGFATETRTGRVVGGVIPLDVETTSLTRTYEHRTGPAWRLGLPTGESVTGYAESLTGAPDLTRLLAERHWTFDPQGALATESVRLHTAGDCAVVPAMATTTYTYWPVGLVQRVARAGKATAELSYDAAWLYKAREQTTVTRFRAGQPAGTTPLLIRNSTDLRHGRITRTVGLNGEAVVSTYDSRGRLLEAFGPDGTLAEKRTYSDAAPVSVRSVIHTDVGKSYTRVEHLDGHGHSLGVVETGGAFPFVRTARTRYDAFGRPAERFLPAATTSLAAYALPTETARALLRHDGFDRVTSATTPDGAVTTTAYGPNTALQTNPRGFATRRVYALTGGLVRVERLGANGAVLAAHDVVRDGLGRVVRVVDADGNVRRLERDVGGRLRRLTLPHPTSAQPAPFELCQDRDGHLVQGKTPAGRTLALAYDELGRVVRTTAADAAGAQVVTTQEYDEAPSRALGRLARVSDPSGIWAYTYDLYGRQRSLTLALAPAVLQQTPGAPALLTATFDYDRAGDLRVAQISGLPVPVQLRYPRDARGRTTQVVSGGPSDRLLADGLVYDARGRMVEAAFGNGTRARWDYHPLSQRLTGIHSLDASGAPFASVEYTHDPDGNVLTERRRAAGTALLTEKVHAYDPLDRLVSSQLAAPSGSASESYAFSPGGNVKSAASETYAYADPELAQAVTAVASAAGTRALVYDRDGQLTRDTRPGPGGTEVRQLTWAPTGCLTRVEATRPASGGAAAQSLGTTTYRCGFDGRPVVRRTAPATGPTNSRIDFAGLLEVRPEEGVALVRVPVNGTTVVEEARSLATGARVPAASGYVHTDLRQSVLALTPFNAPASATTHAAEYGPWGDTLALGTAPRPSHGFTGHEPDPTLGYYHFGLRAYDPSLRRWLSPDPMLFAAPDQDSHLGEQLNLYQYAANNPVGRVDPSGADAMTVEEAQKVFGLGMSAGTALFAPGVVVEALGDVAVAGIVALAVAGAGLAANAIAEKLPPADATRFLEIAGDIGVALVQAKVGSQEKEKGKVEAVAAVATDKPKKDYSGGRYGDLDTRGGTLDRHHMPSAGSSPLPHDDGPAIQMEPGHHEQTATHFFGKYRGDAAFAQAIERYLVAHGKWLVAVELNVLEIELKFPGVYTRAISQMLTYALKKDREMREAAAKQKK